MFLTAVVIVLALVLLATGVRVVHQQTVAIVESFGKFSRVLQPGINFIIPFVETIAATMDLRVQEVTSEIEIKTKDNVFVTLPVALMTQIIPEMADKSHYLLAGSGDDGDAHEQVATWALNALRASAAGLTLEQLFQDRETLAREVKENIDEKLKKYGYHVADVLVDQPSVADEVQNAFNRVISSQREREAATQEAEARRIRIVEEARAEAEAQRLRAEGVASARAILAKGLTEAMGQAKAKGVDEREILSLLVETNRMDTIRSAAEHGKLVVMDLRSPAAMTLPLEGALKEPAHAAVAPAAPAASESAA
jgi:regulator of protease activity HflC (stomatin/prohibitin superfamily)